MNEKDSDGAEDTSFHLLGIPSGDESHELRSRVPFELLASQFVEELRAGKSPSVDLYARRFPPHTEKIREVFPVLAMLEGSSVDPSQYAGSLPVYAAGELRTVDGSWSWWHGRRLSGARSAFWSSGRDQDSAVACLDCS